jgi:hypothetical protein
MVDTMKRPLRWKLVLWEEAPNWPERLGFKTS